MQIVFSVIAVVLVAVMVLVGIRDIVRAFMTPMSRPVPDPSLLGLPLALIVGVAAGVVMVSCGVVLALSVAFATKTQSVASCYRQVR
jgi:hypothetical protein